MHFTKSLDRALPLESAVASDVAVVASDVAACIVTIFSLFNAPLESTSEIFAHVAF